MLHFKNIFGPTDGNHRHCDQLPIHSPSTVRQSVVHLGKARWTLWLMHVILSTVGPGNKHFTEVASGATGPTGRLPDALGLI